MGTACVVNIEVDRRQGYLFESDKLQEMLGASRIMAQTVDVATDCFEEAGAHLFSPVSGEIRAWAPLERKTALLSAAWKLRTWLDERGVPHTASYLERDDAAFVGGADDGMPGTGLTAVHGECIERTRLHKDAKGGEALSPRCSLFVDCQLHGGEPANYWDPERQTKTHEDEARRELVGWRAAQKCASWRKAREELYERHLLDPIADRLREVFGVAVERAELRRCVVFHDFVQGGGIGNQSDSYIAFICADGDGMGKLLAGLDWNHPDWDADPRFSGEAPWVRNAEFSREFDRCTQQAFAAGVRAVVDLEEQVDKRFADAVRDSYRRTIQVPLLPQLLGGDDLWAIVGRQAALPFCQAFAAEYERAVQAADEFPHIVKAVEVAARGGDRARLTMSMGVAFAKAGYPAHAMANVAEELMRSAKRLRGGGVWKRPAAQRGCIDWHWVESSRVESVEDARRTGWLVGDEKNVGLLTTRPWTLVEAEAFREAADRLTDVPRRKREQLETLLRLHPTVRDLAWEGFWKGLGNSARETLLEVLRALPETWRTIRDDGKSAPPNAWVQLGVVEVPGEEGHTAENSAGEVRVEATPLLDLLALQHVMGKEGAR